MKGTAFKQDKFVFLLGKEVPGSNEEMILMGKLPETNQVHLCLYLQMVVV